MLSSSDAKIIKHSVTNSPAVTQMTATVTPNTHFLMRRCLNGRNVACNRSKEITARLIIEVKINVLSTPYSTLCQSPKDGKLVCQKLQRGPV